VPDNVECCGLVAALSKIVSVALRKETALGEYDTPNVHFVFGATVIGIAPQVPAPLSENSVGSDDDALETMSELAAPVLLMVRRFFVTV
jgi:hypothetical protein